MAEPEGFQTFEIRLILQGFLNHLRFVSIHLSLFLRKSRSNKKRMMDYTKSIIVILEQCESVRVSTARF